MDIQEYVFNESTYLNKGEVFGKYNGDKNKAIRAYAWLEVNSYAQRKNNTHGFGAMYYAEALYNDCIKKRWLK